MVSIRVREAAELLGVSDDSVRRWIDDGSLPADQDESGRKVIAGDALAEFAARTPLRRPRIRSASPAPLAIASPDWSPRW